MKTYNQRIKSSYFRNVIAGILLLISSLITGSVHAEKIFNVKLVLNHKDPCNHKNRPEDEEANLLLRTLEEESVCSQQLKYHIIDEHNDIIFSGPSEDWEDSRQEKLQLLKRKAEFLYQSINEKVYIVFASGPDTNHKSAGALISRTTDISGKK